MIFNFAPLSGSLRGKGKQGQMPSSLDSRSKLALMFGTVPGDPTRKNLSSVADKPSQELFIFIIYNPDLLLTEPAGLPSFQLIYQS